TGAVQRKGAQEQLYRSEIELGGECAEQATLSALRRNGDEQLGALGGGIPIRFADDLILRLELLLPVGGKSHGRSLGGAGGDDMPIEVEHHQRLEVAEALVKRYEVIAQSAFTRAGGDAAATVETADDFVRSGEDAQIIETLSQPDPRCARALRTARQQVFVDFLFESAAVLSIEDAQHGARRKQCRDYREGENSAAQTLEAGEGQGEFRTRARCSLRRGLGGVNGSGFGGCDGHRL